MTHSPASWFTAKVANIEARLPPSLLYELIITHKFFELPVERIAKAEIIRCLLNATWLVTMARKRVPKDMGNDKLYEQGTADRWLRTRSPQPSPAPD